MKLLKKEIRYRYMRNVSVQMSHITIAGRPVVDALMLGLSSHRDYIHLNVEHDACQTCLLRYLESKSQ